jgi:hypothetical protein
MFKNSDGHREDHRAITKECGAGLAIHHFVARSGFIWSVGFSERDKPDRPDKPAALSLNHPPLHQTLTK